MRTFEDCSRELLVPLAIAALVIIAVIAIIGLAKYVWNEVSANRKTRGPQKLLLNQIEQLTNVRFRVCCTNKEIVNVVVCYLIHGQFRHADPEFFLSLKMDNQDRPHFWLVRVLTTSGLEEEFGWLGDSRWSVVSRDEEGVVIKDAWDHRQLILNNSATTSADNIKDLLDFVGSSEYDSVWAYWQYYRSQRAAEVLRASSKVQHTRRLIQKIKGLLQQPLLELRFYFEETHQPNFGLVNTEEVETVTN